LQERAGTLVLNTENQTELQHASITSLPDADLSSTEINSIDIEAENPTVTPEPDSEMDQLIGNLQSKLESAQQQFGVDSVTLRIAFVPSENAPSEFSRAHGTGMPYLMINGEGVSIDGLALDRGSIVFQTGENNGQPTYGYLEPVEVEGYGATTPVIEPMTAQLHDYLTDLNADLEVPAEGDWVALSFAGDRPVSLAANNDAGEPIAIVISFGEGQEAPTTPEAPVVGVAIAEADVSQETNLEQSLDNWVSGETVLNDEDYFQLNGKPYPLGIMGDEKKDLGDPSTHGSQGYDGRLLGDEVVDGHLIVYLGFEDQDHHRFYAPFDFGDVTDDSLVNIALMPNPQGNRDMFPLGNLRADIVHPAALEQRVDGLVGRVVHVNTQGPAYVEQIMQHDSTNHDLVQALIARATPQFPLVLAFQDYMFAIHQGRPFSEDTAPDYINKRVTRYDAANLMMSLQISYINP
jgi:hypothetical protein